MRCTYGHKKIQTVQTINIGLYMCRRVTAVQSCVLFVFFPFFLKRKTCGPGRNTFKGTVSRKHIGNFFLFLPYGFKDVPFQWEHAFVQRTSPISLLLLLSVESTRRWARESNPGLTLRCVHVQYTLIHDNRLVGDNCAVATLYIAKERCVLYILHTCTWTFVKDGAIWRCSCSGPTLGHGWQQTKSFGRTRQKFYD